MSQTSRHKQALLHAIDREWMKLLRVIEQITPGQMTAPDAGGWSPKDNLAHLSAWMKALLEHHIDHKAAEEVFGVPKEFTDDTDETRVNAFLLERNRNRSAEDVVAELKTKYAEVIARLESVPFDDLLQPRFSDDPDRTPLLNYVLGNTADHFREHRENIEKGLKKK
jgi:hypothetical protein